MFKEFRNYIIGNALKSAEDSFEKAKLKLFFNVTVVSSILFTLSSIPLLINRNWYLMTISLIGLVLLALLFLSLKRNGSYTFASIIFMLSVIFVVVATMIVNGGEASYLTFGLTISIIPFMFLMLPKFGGYFYLIFSIIIVFVTISISHKVMDPIDIGIDFSNDINYYRNPNPLVAIMPLFFLMYLLYEFILTEKRARNLIINQKEDAVTNKSLLQEKNKSINENIDYASQIQRSLLPETKKLDALFEENFIFFKPVDQLSGDLYWIDKKDDISFFAVIDSSESGVSGAMISFICYNALNMAINEINLKQPSKILDYVKDYFTHTLNKEKRKAEISLALCSYDSQNKILNYAGEDNPIFILRKDNIIEYKPQQSSPEKLKNKTSYKNQKISLEKDDIIYIFSDGFANQNKNMSSEKLKASVFKQFLLSISEESLPDQKKQLKAKLKEWLNYEQQSDDICILGLKVP